MKCFVDLDGKILAKMGDRVARAECGDIVFFQQIESMRPIYVEFDGIGGISDTAGYGISGHNGEYLHWDINPPE